MALSRQSYAGVSFTVAMPWSRKSYAGVSGGSYGFVVPGSCAGVSLAVAVAFRVKAVVVAVAFRAKAVR